MKELTRKCLSLVLMLLAAQMCCYAQAISVAPSRIFFHGNPGETVNQLVKFNNSSADEVSFVGRLQDFARDTTGVKVYYKSNTLPHSNAGWVSLSSNAITIAPHSTADIIVSLAIPANQSVQPRLTNSMLFFTQVKKQGAGVKPQGSIGITVLLEFGIQIYNSPPGLARGELQIADFRHTPPAARGNDSLRKVSVKLVNTGALNVDASVRFELTNKETGDELKIKPMAIAMLPNASQWVSAELPASLKGRFLVVAIVDSGISNDLKVAEKEIIYNN